MMSFRHQNSDIGSTDPIANEMFTHCFNPMQSQAVQHGTRAFHHAKNSDCEKEPHIKEDNDHDDSEGPGEFKGFANRHVPKHN